MEQIIMKAMAHDPAQRYANPTSMLYDMDEFRKDPTILFDYSENGESVIIMPPKDPAAAPAKTGDTPSEKSKPAEKTGEKKKPAKPQGKPTQNTTHRRPAPARYPEDDEDDGRSQVATIAVVVCSIVALIAIGIFLYTLLNGGLILTPQRVRVPTLVGQNYTNLLQIEDLQIVVQENVYSDYEAGYIIHQEPAGGRSVAKGTEIYLTVSKGPETNSKVMPNLVEVTADDAQDYLNDLNAKLKITVRKEAHATIPAGRVIRTDPVEKTHLNPGQTVVLWISIGPAAQKAKMPYVVGYTEADAKEALEQVGLTNWDISYVESDRAEGTVIYQSKGRNEEVNVTDTIYLQVSKGLPNHNNNQDDPEIPTTPPASYVEQVITIPLPQRSQDYTLTLLLGGKPVSGCENLKIEYFWKSIDVTLLGEGTQYYEVFIDGRYYMTIPVDFNAVG
jgi:serine/threonine-protein kinase